MVNEKNIVYFLGAGFTKAIANTAPTGTEFFVKAFANNAPFAGDGRIDNVKSFIEKNYYPLQEENNYPQIEDVLSLIDYSIQEGEGLSEKYPLDAVITVKNNLIYLIGRVIQYSIDEEPRRKNNSGLCGKFIELLQSQSRNGSKVSIISSNYDLIIDNALLAVAQSCNYGVSLRKNLEVGNRECKRPQGDTSWGGGRLNEGEFQLLKIHGSLNWLYCPTCEKLDITIREKRAVELTKDEGTYTCVEEPCDAKYEPLLVTPTMLKTYDSPPLKKLWEQSEKVISQATELIFIGYSLPAADYYIKSLITKALAKNKKRSKVIIVEKKSDPGKPEEIEEVKKRYKMLFGERIDFRPIGLEEFLQTSLTSQISAPA